jgi:hypothetical protein
MAHPKLSSTSRLAIGRIYRSGRGATPATVAIHLAATLLQVLCAVSVPRTRYMRSDLVARETLKFDRHMMEMSDRSFQRPSRLSEVDFMNFSFLLRPHLERHQSLQPSGAIHSDACSYDANSCGRLLIDRRMALRSGGRDWV